VLIGRSPPGAPAARHASARAARRLVCAQPRSAPTDHAVSARDVREVRRRSRRRSRPSGTSYGPGSASAKALACSPGSGGCAQGAADDKGTPWGRLPLADRHAAAEDVEHDSKDHHDHAADDRARDARDARDDEDPGRLARIRQPTRPLVSPSTTRSCGRAASASRIAACHFPGRFSKLSESSSA
jgi:hypothetical protein